MGGHLAIVRSEEQNRFVLEQMQRAGVEAAWLGATDEKVEGQWVWVDGTPMRFNLWSSAGKQPNNKRELEHYLALMIADGHWCDQPNVAIDMRPGFVCEWD